MSISLFELYSPNQAKPDPGIFIEYDNMKDKYSIYRNGQQIFQNRNYEKWIVLKELFINADNFLTYEDLCYPWMDKDKVDFMREELKNRLTDNDNHLSRQELMRMISQEWEDSHLAEDYSRRLETAIAQLRTILDIKDSNVLERVNNRFVLHARPCPPPLKVLFSKELQIVTSYRDLWVPRDSELNEMEENSFHPFSNIYYVCGERGIGKTSLVRQFAKNCICGRASRPELLFHTVLYASFQTDLRTTLGTLLDDAFPEFITKDKEQFVLRILESLEKPVLLILDNFDGTLVPSLQQDKYYQKLCSIGVRLLVVTSTFLSQTRYPRTKVDALPRKELVRLFQFISEQHFTAEEEKIIEALVEHLRDNTYLVSLAAVLCRRISVHQLHRELTHGNVSSFHFPIPDTKWSSNEDHSFFELLGRLYDLSQLKNDPSYETERAILFNMALVPYQGIDRGSLLEKMSCGSDTVRDNLEKSIEALCNQYLLNIEKNQLSVHPLLKDLIAEKELNADVYPLLENFITHTADQMNVASFTAAVDYNLKLALEAYRILSEKADIRSYSFIKLIAGISSAYEFYGNRDKELEYSRIAIPQLISYSEKQNLSDEKKKEVATLLNITGYSMTCFLNSEEDCSDLEVQNKRAYDKALSLIADMEGTPFSVQERSALEILKMKLYGNYGAMHRSLGHHKEAIQYHTQTLRDRMALFQKYKTSTLYFMIAQTQLSLSCDYFDMADSAQNMDEKTEYLFQAMEHVKEARKGYTSRRFQDESNQLKLLRVYNRHAYTFLTVLDVIGDESKVISRTGKDTLEMLEDIHRDLMCVYDLLENFPYKTDQSGYFINEYRMLCRISRKKGFDPGLFSDLDKAVMMLEDKTPS